MSNLGKVISGKSGSNMIAPDQIDNFVTHLKAEINNKPMLRNSALTQLAISTENFDNAKFAEVRTISDTFSNVLNGIATSLGIEVTPAMEAASKYGGFIGADVRSFIGSDLKPVVGASDARVINNIAVEDYTGKRLSLEAYDETNNKDANITTITYNFFAARQDEFAETHFPTITIPPDNAGFGVVVDVMYVYDEVLRKISGDPTLYHKRNLIRAFADPTILKNETNRMVPVFRPESAHQFGNQTDVPAYDFNLEGEVIKTAPLKFGETIDLMGISQPDSMLVNGVKGVEDAMEPAVKLLNLWFKVGDDILKLDVSNIPYSNFTYGTQNNYRLMQLNLDTTSVLVSKLTKQYNGADLSTLSLLATQNMSVRLKVVVSGSVNIETGDTTLYGTKVETFAVFDEQNQMIPTTSGNGEIIKNLINSATFHGYDLLAYRTNSNRRQRGQLIDTSRFTQLYNVPLRAPVTAIHTVNSSEQINTSDIKTLIATTAVRTSQAAITELFNTANILREYIKVQDLSGESPDVLGCGRVFIKPTFFEEELDMNKLVDSLTSTDRDADINAAIMNKVRNYAFRMYRDSEYQPAMTMRGYVNKTPTVVIGTDQVLARYLQITGDVRTLGGGLDHKIVSTADRRMIGKIVMTFHIFDETRNTEVNPLNFGNMAWSPEATVVLPISRRNQISVENCVTPRFLHFVNCPIMTVLTVKGIEDVIEKLPINFNQI